MKAAIGCFTCVIGALMLGWLCCPAITIAQSNLDTAKSAPKIRQGSLELPTRKRPSNTLNSPAANNPPVASPSASPGATDIMKISPERGPINIRADSLDLDYKKKQVFYRGHVHATQADATLDSDTLQVIYGANFNDIKQVIATGHVRMTRGTDIVTGQKAVLDEDKQTVVITGNPVVQNGQDRVAGDRILVYLESQRSIVENAHAILYPHQQQTTGEHSNDREKDREIKIGTDGSRN